METKHIRSKGDSGRCKKQRCKQSYSKKRKYHGEKKKQTDDVDVHIEEASASDADFTVGSSSNTIEKLSEDVQELPEVVHTQTISAAKVVDIEIEPTTEVLSGYRLMDVSILADVLLSLVCPECVSTNSLHLKDINEKKKGLARYFQLQCTVCPYTKDFCSSKQINRTTGNNKGGGKFMEVNLRAVYGMREIGMGHTPLKKLCSFMNMPEPMSNDNFDNITKTLKDVTKVVTEKSMTDASKELRGDEETMEASVSVDGTWQKKGFTSSLGVVTAISVDNGKVLDCTILSKSCKGCLSMEPIKKSDPERYEVWKANHECNLNYSGSSPNMEKVGAVFERSLQRHGLYYTSFYGDGDSKRFASVQYIFGPDKPVTKY